MSQFEDKDLECIEKNCENEGSFVWPAGEQQFFHDKGLYTPKRCPDCRRKKREQQTQDLNE